MTPACYWSVHSTTIIAPASFLDDPGFEYLPSTSASNSFGNLFADL
jgi:hypothetical protein